MLNVQTWLKNQNGDLELLKKQLGIDFTPAQNDSRVILNYNQIESPKTNEIVRECRGLVLDSRDWSLVARSFPRFFNAGEVPSEDEKFNWDTATVTHKEDGSLTLLYFYDGEWRVNTRGSFSDGYVNGLGFTWRDLFFSAFGDITRLQALNKDETYVFELCSPYTQIVRSYDTPQIYLLTIFNNNTGCEMSQKYTDSMAIVHEFKQPLSCDIKEHSYAQNYILNKCDNDPTFEGLVVRDFSNNRLKIKSHTYLQLHRLNNNGNVALPKNIARIILEGEITEVLTYFPHLKSDFEKVQQVLNKWFQDMDNAWFCHHDQVSQRKFAEAIQKEKLKFILFDARKKNTSPLELIKTGEYNDNLCEMIRQEFKV